MLFECNNALLVSELKISVLVTHPALVSHFFFYFGLFILLLKYEDKIRRIPINIYYLDIILKDINYTFTREIDNIKYYNLLILKDTTFKFLVEYLFTSI